MVGCPKSSDEDPKYRKCIYLCILCELDLMDGRGGEQHLHIANFTVKWRDSEWKRYGIEKWNSNLDQHNTFGYCIHAFQMNIIGTWLCINLLRKAYENVMPATPASAHSTDSNQCDADANRTRDGWAEWVTVERIVIKLHANLPYM